MFQDYDNEVLCSILFEQCNGDLDKSIQSILNMQMTESESVQNRKKLFNEENIPKMGSSLMEENEEV